MLVDQGSVNKLNEALQALFQTEHSQDLTKLVKLYQDFRRIMPPGEILDPKVWNAYIAVWNAYYDVYPDVYPVVLNEEE